MIVCEASPSARWRRINAPQRPSRRIHHLLRVGHLLPVGRVSNPPLCPLLLGILPPATAPCASIPPAMPKPTKPGTTTCATGASAANSGGGTGFRCGTRSATASPRISIFSDRSPRAQRYSRPARGTISRCAIPTALTPNFAAPSKPPDSRRIPMSSTPGFPPPSGLSRPSAGPSHRRK